MIGLAPAPDFPKILIWDKLNFSQKRQFIKNRGFSIKNDDGTEFVQAFVVKKDDSLTKEEVIETCREKLTNYKVPKVIHFRDELPKSNVGKILRRLLK